MHPLLVKAGSGAVALATGAGLMLATASSAVAEGAPQASISVQGPATLIAHGVAISVPVVVSCSTDGDGASGFLSVSQAIGKRVASSGTFFVVSCTGAPETVLVTLLISSGVPFSKGHDALAQATIISCNFNGCGQDADSATIRIQ